MDKKLFLARGKRVDTLEWVYGYYTEFSSEYGRGDYIADGDHDYPVIPETVGRYIGVDRNNKDFYEGDIHSVSDPEKYFVFEWGKFTDADLSECENCYGWYAKNAHNGECYRLDGTEARYVNIVGNIYDTPELVEGYRTPTNEIQTVYIPSCENHEGIYGVYVRLRWVCPKCGRRRGVVKSGVSYDGSLTLAVSAWENPCGHIDKYDAVLREALENGLNIATEVIPSNHGEGEEV